MNKVTKAVIDLGGKWIDVECTWGGVTSKGIGMYSVSSDSPSTLKVCADGVDEAVCTRQEFDKELVRLRSTFSQRPDDGSDFAEWLHKLGRKDWPTDERIDAIGQNGGDGEHYDAVEHPKHYKSHPSGIECIQITEHMGFNLGNALKYIWRCDEKHDDIEDLKKAKWYIEREISKREKANDQ